MRFTGATLQHQNVLLGNCIRSRQGEIEAVVVILTMLRFLCRSIDLVGLQKAQKYDNVEKWYI